MDIVDVVRKTIEKYMMLLKNDYVLVGLSGGPDSICLLKILDFLRPELDFTLAAAYVDHRLRPNEVINEKRICADLCKLLNIPFFVESVDVMTFKNQHRLNKQEAARQLRYDALQGIAYNIKANKIALGHNADDQAETMIMRLIRGSGPLGLSGIPPIRTYQKIYGYKVDIIRPLIEIERSDIERFLSKNNLSFATDSSNLSENYLRNRIRNFIMPFLKTVNKDIVKTLCRTADILRDEERFFELTVTKTLMKLISRKNDNQIELFLRPLESMDRVILRRILRRAIDETRDLRGIGFIHIEEIIDLIKSGQAGERIYLPNDIRVIKGYSTLILTTLKPLKINTCYLNIPGVTVLKEAGIVIEASLKDISEINDYGDGKRLATVDLDKLQFPIIIRSRSSGDFFYPLGFGKRKKVQDFFVDEKIPRDERDCIPILTTNNNIVWIIGHRLDERYKVDKNTRRVLKLTIKPSHIG
jgi:tRNA(Ile)-lysidine synthase